MNAMDHGRLSLDIIRHKLPGFLLIIVLATFWFTGGSSRADVSGQALTRLIAWISIVLMALSVTRLHFRDSRPVALILLGIVLLPVLFLIPLPSTIWQNLPGRELLSESPAISDGIRSWRPATISPVSTLNALFSLSVPTAVLILILGMKPDDRSWLPTILLCLILASMFAGLIQLSGIQFSSPFVNYQASSVSGTFANRNHFSVLLAIGCLVTPVWACMHKRHMRWRVPLAIGIVFLLALTILAVGSRAGMGVGILALILTPFLLREQISHAVSNKYVIGPKVTLMLIVSALVLLIVLSIVFGRAVSIERMGELSGKGDMRSLGFSTVLEITKGYFPIGVGAGAFDAAFRIYEPNNILSTLYFNHAHNDLIEIILESGIFGVAIMVVAMGWWANASMRVWRRPKIGTRIHITGRLGSAIILLVLLASAVDYPARTPLIMAVLVIAACWLAWGNRAACDPATLPRDARPL